MAFDAVEFLEFFGYDRIKNHNEENVMASCHNEEMHTQGDLKRSFGMLTKPRRNYDGSVTPAGTANCYVCGGWTLEQLTVELMNKKMKKEGGGRFNEYDAVVLLEEKGWLDEGETIEDVSERFKSLGGFAEIKAPAPKEIPVYSKDEMAPYLTSMHRRALQRGETKDAIDIQTARDFLLGFDKETKRIIIPVLNDKHEIVGVTSRATRDDDFIRYGVGTINPAWYRSQYTNEPFDGEKMLYTFDKRHFVYGEHTWYNEDGSLKFDTIMVLESPLDVVYAHSQGLHEYLNIGAIFGSKCTREQLQKILQHDRVIEAFDNDVPGQEGREKFHKDVLGKCKLFTFDSYGKKDLGDCTPDEVQLCYLNAKPYENNLFGNLKPILD